MIDYFSEMTFVREGDSINFQKASCTLDGCVKIYSSRVDSIVDETGKLLTGLSEGVKGSQNIFEDSEDVEDLEISSKKPLRKRVTRTETLEKSFESLKVTLIASSIHSMD